MKRLSVYLFLILFTLQTPSQADDISVFQIEGISIGDSMLDHMTEKEIKKAEQNSTRMGKKFKIIYYYYSPNGSKLFDYVTVTLKVNDKKYLIHSISGYLDFPDDIKGCKKKMNEFKNDMKDLFKDSPIKKRANIKHKSDKSGKSKFTSFDISPKSGGWATSGCTDWSDEMTNKHGWKDALDIGLHSEEYTNYLNTDEAYK